RPAHNKQIKIIIFHESVLETEFRIVRLGHSGRDRTLLRHLRPRDLLADVPESGVYLHSENLVQIGIRVRIHSEDRTLALLAEILDQHSAQSSLSNAAFTCDGNHMCHNY